MAKPEHDERVAILDSLLTTPHRDLDRLWGLHEDLARRDPRFYAHLAAWYFEKGEVRDHKHVFVAALALSKFEGHRDVGLALLRRLPPWEVTRVVDFIHGDQKAADARAARAQAEAEAKHRKGKPKKQKKLDAKPDGKAKPSGLFRNLPRSLKTEVERMLREREADPDALDAAALHGRKALVRLYALLHVKPGPLAQRILFDDDPPEGTRVRALKDLAKLTDPVEQARAIVAGRIPFRVAVGAIKRLTPSVLVALVDAMSSQELINHLGMLREHGAFEDPGLERLIHERLERAKGDRRVQAMKGSVAAAAAGVDKKTKAALAAVAEARLQAKGRIRRSTGLLCDKSGSMEQAIEVTKRLGALVATICEQPLVCWAFDTVAYPVAPGDGSLASWERAFLGITAGGGTSCGVALQAMRKRNQRVEQVVLVTDEEENTAPRFADELARYGEALGVVPHVVIVRVGRGLDQVERALREAGHPVDVVRFTGDYYALPNVIPFLEQPGRADLVLEILETPLPVRPAPAPPPAEGDGGAPTGDDAAPPAGATKKPRRRT